MSDTIIYRVLRFDYHDQDLHGLYRTLDGAKNGVNNAEWKLNTVGDQGYHWWSYRMPHSTISYEIEEVLLHD